MSGAGGRQGKRQARSGRPGRDQGNTGGASLSDSVLRDLGSARPQSGHQRWVSAPVFAGLNAFVPALPYSGPPLLPGRPEEGPNVNKPSMQRTERAGVAGREGEQRRSMRATLWLMAMGD